MNTAFDVALCENISSMFNKSHVETVNDIGGCGVMLGKATKIGHDCHVLGRLGLLIDR